MAEKIQSSEIKISSFTSFDIEDLKSFCCGCEEMDNYIRLNLSVCDENRYVSTYIIRHIYSNEIIAIFTLANDALIIQSNEDKEDVVTDNPIIASSSYVDYFLKQTSFPAVNIAHLAVSEMWQSRDVGTLILDFVINTYANFRVAGCQFITVDALNNPRVMKFYIVKNGFTPLTICDMTSDTRRLYIPLAVFK